MDFRAAQALIPTHNISFVGVGMAENNDEIPHICIFFCSENIQRVREVLYKAGGYF